MFLLWCSWFPNTLFERWVLRLHKQSYQYDFHTIRYCVKSKRPYFSNNINTVCVAKWHSFTWVFPIYFELLMTYDTLLLMSALSSHFDNFAIILGLHQGMTTFRPTSWNPNFWSQTTVKWPICHVPSYIIRLYALFM